MSALGYLALGSAIDTEHTDRAGNPRLSLLEIYYQHGHYRFLQPQIPVITGNFLQITCTVLLAPNKIVYRNSGLQ